MSKVGLAVIDLQNVFLKNKKKLHVFLDKVIKHLEDARLANIPIGVLEMFPFDSTIYEVKNVLGDYAQYISKSDTSGAYELMNFYPQVNKWYLCGVYTCECVKDTALGLTRAGKSVRILADSVWCDCRNTTKHVIPKSICKAVRSINHD